MTARVLVIGLDAGDPTTVRELAAAGRMPTMARLLAEGAVRPMTEPRGGAYVAERWTSIATGVGPAVHGFHTWARYDTGRDGDRTVSVDPHATPRIWDVLSAAGRRVAVIDVPRQPPSDVNGILIHEWGTHDRTVGTETSPAALVAALEAEHGEHALAAARAEGEPNVSTCDVICRSGRERRTNHQLRALDALLRASVRTKSGASEALLGSEPWDLFFTVFGESHCATHQLWHLHRPTTPRDRESRALLGDPVEETFATIDASIARHLDLAGPDTTTFVVLHTGMETRGGGRDLFPAVLRCLPDAAALVPCSVPTGNGIRLLVRGRDPGGVVEPGDVEAVVERVRASLLELVDDRTGTAAVASVRRRAEVVPELADDDRLADLYLEWHEHGSLDRVSSPELGIVHADRVGVRTGDHTPDGLLVVHGAGATPGGAEPIDPVEVAPWIAELLGVPFDPAQPRTAFASSS